MSILDELKKGNEVYVYFECPKGYGFIRKYSYYPPDEIEQLVVDKEHNYFFTPLCEKCRFGEWRDGRKYCKFKRVDKG